MNQSRLLLRLSSSRNSKKRGVKYRVPIAQASGQNKFAEHLEEAIRLIAMHTVAGVLEDFEARDPGRHRIGDVLRIGHRQNRIELARRDQRRAFYLFQIGQEVEG